VQNINPRNVSNIFVPENWKNPRRKTIPELSQGLFGVVSLGSPVLNEDLIRMCCFHVDTIAANQINEKRGKGRSLNTGLRLDALAVIRMVRIDRSLSSCRSSFPGIAAKVEGSSRTLAAKLRSLLLSRQVPNPRPQSAVTNFLIRELLYFAARAPSFILVLLVLVLPPICCVVISPNNPSPTMSTAYSEIDRFSASLKVITYVSWSPAQ
jgi:hypothetical protein